MSYIFQHVKLPSQNFTMSSSMISSQNEHSDLKSVILKPIQTETLSNRTNPPSFAHYVVAKVDEERYGKKAHGKQKVLLQTIM